jgi:hypothetical protein
LVFVAAYVWKDLVMHFVVQLENLAAGSAQIFLPNGGVVAPFALFAPDPDVA